LAEVAAYEHNHRAVTFESPGSGALIKKLKRYLKKQESLENLKGRMVSYLTLPNFINTLKPHVGTVYRMYPKALQMSKWSNVKNIDDLISPIAELPIIKQKAQKAQKTVEEYTSMLPFFRESAVNASKSFISKRVRESIEEIIKMIPLTLRGQTFPILKILIRDYELHQIDNILREFEENIDKPIPLNRREVVEWPCGLLQYFSLATLMIEKNQYEPDALIDENSKYLFYRKSVRYELVHSIESKERAEAARTKVPEINNSVSENEDSALLTFSFQGKPTDVDKNSVTSPVAVAIRAKL